jgi:DNA-binding NarL/FixJ family response regulator
LTLRILIADDHPAFRQGLALMLEATDDLEVVGQAATGSEAVALAVELGPDVVVMDIRMPDMNGIDATRRLLAAVPQAGVAVLTMFEDDDSVFAAMRAGASGYLVKGAGQDEIVRAIRSVADGHAIFGPSVAQRIIAFFATGTPSAEPFPELTAREREVLNLIAAGRSNGAIAKQLVISSKTVSNHTSAIFAKLQVADRAQAIVRARHAGLGQDS